MRKNFLFIQFSFAIATLITITMITPAQADIQSPNFIGVTYRGHDEFYGKSVVAYEAGSNATVAIPVYNDYYVERKDRNYSYEARPLNVSAVKIGFDWGINYSATLPDIIVIEPYQTHVFILNFTVPSTTIASNLVVHSYIIYVEHHNSTAPPWETYTWTRRGYDFAVYSEDQAEAQDLYRQLVSIGLTTYVRPYYYYMPPITNFPYLPIVSSEARMLWTKARTEASIGSSSYAQGDFGDAKTHYQTAYNMANQSLTIEATKGALLEEALTNLMNSMAETSKMQTQAFMILSVGIFIGIILIGIGVIVYALAKRKIASATPTSSS